MSNREPLGEPAAPAPRDAARTGSETLAAVARIRSWGEARDWRGWDPYDALNGPLARVLTLGTSLGRRLVLQAVKRAPVNLRPLLGVRPAHNQKAIGLVASGYVHLASAGDASARAAAARWLDWLEEGHVGGTDGRAWGYHFDVETRFFRYGAHSPNTIATAFAAQAFLDAAERLGDERRAATAVGAAEFLVARMLVAGPGGPFFRYIPGDEKLIHNCNLLASAVLARAARLTGRSDLAETAAAAVATSLAGQRPDGAWPYSAWAGQDWVDNFHTGYVLESLAACADVPGVPAALERGSAFWARELFLPDGTPRPAVGRNGPRDGHAYAQAVDTWLALHDAGLPGLAQARRVAALLVRDMLTPAGWVVAERRTAFASRVAFVRWTTAPSFRALARLAAAEGRL